MMTTEYQVTTYDSKFKLTLGEKINVSFISDRSYNSRNTQNALIMSAVMSDGQTATLGGFHYIKDSTKTGHTSALYDLGVEGFDINHVAYQMGCPVGAWGVVDSESNDQFDRFNSAIQSCSPKKKKLFLSDFTIMIGKQNNSDDTYMDISSTNRATYAIFIPENGYMGLIGTVGCKLGHLELNSRQYMFHSENGCFIGLYGEIEVNPNYNTQTYGGAFHLMGVESLYLEKINFVNDNVLRFGASTTRPSGKAYGTHPYWDDCYGTHCLGSKPGVATEYNFESLTFNNCRGGLNIESEDLNNVIDGWPTKMVVRIGKISATNLDGDKVPHFPVNAYALVVQDSQYADVQIGHMSINTAKSSTDNAGAIKYGSGQDNLAPSSLSIGSVHAVRCPIIVHYDSLGSGGEKFYVGSVTGNEIGCLLKAKSPNLVETPNPAKLFYFGSVNVNQWSANDPEYRHWNGNHHSVLWVENDSEDFPGNIVEHIVINNFKTDNVRNCFAYCKDLDTLEIANMSLSVERFVSGRPYGNSAFYTEGVKLKLGNVIINHTYSTFFDISLPEGRDSYIENLVVKSKLTGRTFYIQDDSLGDIEILRGYSNPGLSGSFVGGDNRNHTTNLIFKENFDETNAGPVDGYMINSVFLEKILNNGFSSIEDMLSWDSNVIPNNSIIKAGDFSYRKVSYLSDLQSDAGVNYKVQPKNGRYYDLAWNPDLSGRTDVTAVYQQIASSLSDGDTIEFSEGTRILSDTVSFTGDYMTFICKGRSSIFKQAANTLALDTLISITGDHCNWSSGQVNGNIFENGVSTVHPYASDNEYTGRGELLKVQGNFFICDGLFVEGTQLNTTSEEGVPCGLYIIGESSKVTNYTSLRTGRCSIRDWGDHTVIDDANFRVIYNDNSSTNGSCAILKDYAPEIPVIPDEPEGALRPEFDRVTYKNLYAHSPNAKWINLFDVNVDGSLTGEVVCEDAYINFRNGNGPACLNIAYVNKFYGNRIKTIHPSNPTTRACIRVQQGVKEVILNDVDLAGFINFDTTTDMKLNITGNSVIGRERTSDHAIQQFPGGIINIKDGVTIKGFSTAAIQLNQTDLAYSSKVNVGSLILEGDPPSVEGRSPSAYLIDSPKPDDSRLTRIAGNFAVSDPLSITNMKKPDDSSWVTDTIGGDASVLKGTNKEFMVNFSTESDDNHITEEGPGNSRNNEQDVDGWLSGMKLNANNPAVGEPAIRVCSRAGSSCRRPYATGEAISVGERRYNGTSVYVCTQAIPATTTAPTGTSTSVDGDGEWTYVAEKAEFLLVANAA